MTWQSSNQNNFFFNIRLLQNFLFLILKPQETDGSCTKKSQWNMVIGRRFIPQLKMKNETIAIVKYGLFGFFCHLILLIFDNIFIDFPQSLLCCKQFLVKRYLPIPGDFFWYTVGLGMVKIFSLAKHLAPNGA